MRVMEPYKAQEAAVFRGATKAILLGIAVVTLMLVVLSASCYAYLSVESGKAKAEAEEKKRLADQRYEENLRKLYN